MQPRFPRLTASVALATVVVLALLGGTAHAVWSASTDGTGSLRAKSLLAPVATAAATSTSAISVSWTVGEQPGAPSYAVKRDGTTVLSCTSSPCTDSGLASGSTHAYVVTAKLGGWTKDSASASATTVAAATTTQYAVTATSPQTAGSSFNVTLTAKLANGTTTDTTYAGAKALTWSGNATATSPGSVDPTLPSSATFANGVATASVVLTSSGAGRTLAAASGSIAGSTTVTVTPGAAATLTLAPSVSTVSTGSTLSATLTAFDAYGNTASGYTGSRTLAWSDGSGVAGSLTSPNGTAAALPTSVTFSGGSASLSGLRLVRAGANQTIQVREGSVVGRATMTVTPGTATNLGFTATSFTGPASPDNSAVRVCFGCSVAVGSGGSLTATVSLVDAYGNVGSTLTTETRIDRLDSTGGTVTTNPATPLTIAAGATSSAGTVKLEDTKTNNGTFSYTLTAGSTGLGTVTATIRK